MKYLIRGNYSKKDLKYLYTISKKKFNLKMDFEEWLKYSGKVYFSMEVR